jgi:hypothetical protein
MSPVIVRVSSITREDYYEPSIPICDFSCNLLVLTTTPRAAWAAKSPAMQACSAQWADMKKAGRTEGQTWPQFWSQCSKDYAAKNEGGAAEPEKTTKSSKKTATAAVDESDSTGSGQQKKECDAKWGSYKAKSGAHGWHDYFQFMAKCM